MNLELEFTLQQGDSTGWTVTRGNTTIGVIFLARGELFYNQEEGIVLSTKSMKRITTFMEFMEKTVCTILSR